MLLYVDLKRSMTQRRPFNHRNVTKESNPLPWQDMSVLGSVNVLSIHERYAYDLFSWGDYEGAVGHFLTAQTPVDHVLSLFPSLAPPEFVPPGGSLEGNVFELCF